MSYKKLVFVISVVESMYLIVFWSQDIFSLCSQSAAGSAVGLFISAGGELAQSFLLLCAICLLFLAFIYSFLELAEM